MQSTGLRDVYELLDDHGRSIGLVEAPCEEPTYGRTAPKLYLRRGRP